MSVLTTFGSLPTLTAHPTPPTYPPSIDSVHGVTGIEKIISKTTSISLACTTSYEMIAIYVTAIYTRYLA